VVPVGARSIVVHAPAAPVGMHALSAAPGVRTGPVGAPTVLCGAQLPLAFHAVVPAAPVHTIEQAGSTGNVTYTSGRTARAPPLWALTEYTAWASGAGSVNVAGAPGASDDDLAWAERVLGAVGTVVRVDESQLDAVTGLTGSGPAYVFLLAESLIDAGLDVGLDPDDVEAMVTQLLVGSAALLAERGDPARLREMVTSPNGTTAAGLQVLGDRGLRGIVTEAVRAATERSRELGT